jgi:hypothetical protein
MCQINLSIGRLPTASPLRTETSARPAGGFQGNYTDLLRARKRWRLLVTHMRHRASYWITSSAVANSVSGMVRPSAFAVLMLIVSSMIVG